ncbi:hypothetical protein HDV64DRAFT_217289 [Trichoderma sp. TUCIM 5745]
MGKKKLLSFSAVVSVARILYCLVWLLRSHILVGNLRHTYSPQKNAKNDAVRSHRQTLLTLLVLLTALIQLRYLLNLPFAAVSLRGQGKLCKDK